MTGVQYTMTDTQSPRQGLRYPLASTERFLFLLGIAQLGGKGKVAPASQVLALKSTVRLQMDLSPELDFRPKAS